MVWASLSEAENIPRYQLANVRMYNNVKKGDIILVPRIPEWGFVHDCQGNGGLEYRLSI